MLSHKVMTRQDVGRAASYYEDGADDYYGKDGDGSEWQGKGAEELGLSGPVDSDRFRELLSGRIAEGVQITRTATRQDSKQRIGIDLTLSAPKSVSLQALVHGDAAVVKAHDLAVKRTIESAEGRAQARQKIKGKTQIENTGNLVVAKFRHETSRETDPQLHTHAIVMNLTKRSDGQWRALKNDEIIKATKYLGAVYNAELAAELQKVGYELRFGRDGNFELAHIDRKQLEGFSQRGAQVEEKLAEKGLTRETASGTEKQQAALQSRSQKTTVDRDELREDWKKKARELGINFEKGELAPGAKNGREVQAFLPEDEAAKRAVKYAINHLTERQSVIDESELVNTAVKHGVGGARMNSIQTEISQQIGTGFLIKEAPRYHPATDRRDADDPNNPKQSLTRAEWVAELFAKGLDREAARKRVDDAIERGGLVEEDPRYTTQTALEREKRILQIERVGRGAVPEIMIPESAQASLAGTNLNAGQRGAAELITTSTSRIIGVQGFAGSGKSHMLDTVKQMIEGQGLSVQSLAPYGSQVKALRELGVESRTVASFLKAKDKRIDENTVLFIDEAAVVPTRVMEQTLKLAEKAGARVVLMGDTAQTKAIEAGKPFHQLQKAGMETAQMKEIQRQKDPDLKIAVERAAIGNTRSALEKIKTVTEIKDPSERRNMVATDYAELTPAERDSTIIVTGTNEAKREINKAVRENLGTAGKGEELDTLIRRDSTQAERRYSKNYHIGDVIQPEKDYKSGLNRGELYSVKDTGPGNRLTVVSKNDPDIEIKFSPSTHRKLSVYEPERTELTAGDIVRITRNDEPLNLANGDRFKVQGIADGKLQLENGQRSVELKTDKPLHLDHAYSATVHSSQGLTSDRVLIDADSKSRTTSKDVFYVAISRARHDAKVYTDDRKKLPDAVSRNNEKHSALDLSREHTGSNRKGRVGDTSVIERTNTERSAQVAKPREHQADRNKNDQREHGR